METEANNIVFETKPYPLMGYINLGLIICGWFILAVAAVLSMGGLIILFVAAGGLAFLKPTFNAIGNIIEINRTRYIITNKQVEIKTGGLFHSQEREMPIRKIENIELMRNSLTDALGYCTVLISGTGGGVLNLMWAINGDKAKEIISELVEKYHEKES
jgi:uncharacterized membrane protein YdbT with pleckstrin-like domain